MKKIAQIIFILMFASILVHSQVQQQWVKTFPYGGSRSTFINIDDSGNVYVTGYSTVMDAPIFTFLQAFKPDGSQLWELNINTPCIPVGVNLDTMNNLYIAGYYGGGWAPADITVFKYNSLGSQVWSNIDTTNMNDLMNAMTGDKAGNSFIAKYISGEHFLQKLNSSGAEQFLVNIPDTIDPKSIALDPDGNIIIWGSAYIGSVNTGVVIKYNPSGIKLWKRLFAPTAFVFGDMEISSSLTGNIYLMCTTRDAEDYYYTLLKYNPRGTQQWVSYYNLKDHSSYATTMYVENCDSKTENIIVTGAKGTVKFDYSGNVVWFDTTSDMNDVKPDNSGNYYLAGSININYSDFRTIKLNNAGIKLWDITYNGTLGYYDAASALAVDKLGNVYVTGASNYTYYFNMSVGTTIKYSEYEIDSSSINFLPLAIGNIWVYKHYTNTPPSSNFEYRGKVKYQIVKDTLMPNGKRYYDRTYLGYTRINPENLSVFVYAEAGEVRKDSLKARMLDTVMTCYYVTDTAGTVVFGDFRRNKFMETYCMVTNQQYFWNLTHGLGYWTYSNITDGTIVGFTDTLVGAVIYGIVYGDTTMDAIKILSNHVPQYYKMYQNYPNPFNPKSKIKFDIAKLGDVKLIIYDVLGREITTLVNERLKAGTYEAEWDALNYSSGVYFYKLITGSYFETKKMVLIK
jgi:hypothetical protein